MITAYKVFTHDLCSPIQLGPPVWGGSLPYTLPTVDVDPSQRECGAGWNACLTQDDALRIAGLWRNGRPSRLFRVETDTETYERGDKIRSSAWNIVEEITDLRPAIERFSAPIGCPGVVDEQLQWMTALASQSRDPQAVEEGLMAALGARDLSDWALRRFDSAQDARAARNARYAMNAMDARDARDALTVYTAGTKGWTEQNPNLLTVGLRDAYLAGLEITIPTGPKELGWSMDQ